MPGKVVLLAMGNDILGDDGVALAAARLLREEIGGKGNLEIRETSEAGLALLEHLEGFDSALILDSVMTGRASPGSLLEFSAGDFRSISAPSPHYAGLPEVLETAQRLEVKFPSKIRILAMEVAGKQEVREGMSGPVQAALSGFVRRAKQMLREMGAVD